MRFRTMLALAVSAELVCGTWQPGDAHGKSKREKRVEEAAAVLAEVMTIPEKGIPRSLIKDAQGIAVVPNVVKVGLFIGGRRGRGVVVVRNESGGWSRPCFVTLTGGSVGWQIGAQSTDIILVFRTRRSIDGIMKGKFTLGADASIAAGPVGRHAGAGTDLKLQAEIYSYSRSRGLFAGLALEGAALRIDDDANAAYYSDDRITAKAVFYDKNVKSPPGAAKLGEQLDKYSKN